MTQWGAEEAKQVLTDSPWVAYVEVEKVRDLSPDERRAGGDMDSGIGNGVGIAGTGILGRRRMAEAEAAAHARPPLGKVMVRWESALPIRFARKRPAIPTLRSQGRRLRHRDLQHWHARHME